MDHTPLSTRGSEALEVHLEQSPRAKYQQHARRSANLGVCIGKVQLCTNEA